ncbi:MAG: radical SAM protein [bacterium]
MNKPENIFLEKTFLEIKVSYFCNLNCSFCVFAHRKKPQLSQSRNKFVLVFKKIKNQYPNLERVIISGGEPTIRPDFRKILEDIETYIKPKEIVLHTNGLAISKESDIKNLVKFNTIIFNSFHTLSNHTHRLFTQTKTLDKIKKNLNNYIKMGLTVDANTLIMKPNQSELSRIADYLVKRKVHGIEFRFPFGTEDRIREYPWILPDDYLSVASQLGEIVKKYSSKISIYIHPSVACILEIKNGTTNRYIDLLWEQAKSTVETSVELSGKKINYVFIDSDMHIVSKNLQQTAVNLNDKLFIRLPRCAKCSFKESCLGIPKELLC